MLPRLRHRRHGGDRAGGGCARGDVGSTTVTVRARDSGRGVRGGLALHLEDGGERGDRGRSPLGFGSQARQARRVAVATVALVADDLAVDELDHTALHLVDESRLVRGHHHGRAVRVDAREQLHDVDRGGGVQVSGRLVGQEHLRPVHERARDRYALLLTAGELVRQTLVLARETHEGEHLGDRLLDESARRSDHLQGERDVLEDGLVGQQPEVLEDRPHMPPEVGHLAVGERAQVAPEHDDAAVARNLFSQDEPQTRRLARPGRADEEHELAADHLEVDVAQGGLRGAAEALRDVLEPDHGQMSLSGGIRQGVLRHPLQRRVSRRLSACASGCRPR